MVKSVPWWHLQPSMKHEHDVRFEIVMVSLMSLNSILFENDAKAMPCTLALLFGNTSDEATVW